MRGQRLLIRPATPDDAGIIASFLAAERCRPAESSDALIGKVVGEIVAHVGFVVEENQLRITSIVVGNSLRRKRVGRAVVAEVMELARKMRRRWVVVEHEASTAAFFEHIGFELRETILVSSVSGGGPEA